MKVFTVICVHAWETNTHARVNLFEMSTYKSGWRWSVSQFSTGMGLLRHGCQRNSFWNSQTNSQMYTFPDQMIDNLSRYQWIPNSTQNLVYSGHRWRKAKDFFVFCSRKICLVLFHCSLVSRHLCLVHKINAQTHHNHPRHLFITWIYRECKVQNGLIS